MIAPTAATAWDQPRHSGLQRRAGAGAAVMRWTARAVLSLVLLVGATTSRLRQGRAVARGVVLLAPLLSASQPAAFVAVGEDISHSQLTLPSASGTVFADVYAPTTPAPLVPGAHGGLLIIPG